MTGHVKFVDRSMVQIKGKGSIMVECKNRKTKMLDQVYYILSLCSNIISLGQLLEEGYKVLLSGDHLWIRDIQGELFEAISKRAI